MFRLYYDLLKNLTYLKPFNRKLLRPFFVLVAAVPVLILTLRIRKFESLIEREGLRNAFAHLSRRFYGGVDVSGEVPQRGPERRDARLYLSNHPGIGDSIVLASLVAHERTKFVVANKRFFHLLPKIRPYLIHVPELTIRQRQADVLGRILSELRDGSDVVLFPTGKIEDDPAISQQANISELIRLGTIIDSKARRKGLELQCSIVEISDVYYTPYFKNSFVTRAKGTHQRQQRAAWLSMLFPQTRNNRIRVRFMPLDESTRPVSVSSGENLDESPRTAVAG